MIQTVIVLALLAIAIYVAWKSYTPTGWDWKQGVAALVALGAAAVTWMTDWIGF
jgi:hypothetical protein